MATSFSYFILSCFLILVFQQYVNGNYVNCYSCTSCGSTVSTWTQVASYSTNTNYCFKSISSGGSVTRGSSNACSPGVDTSGNTNYCCLLDYCNGSISLSNSPGLIFALVIAVCLLKKVIINY